MDQRQRKVILFGVAGIVVLALVVVGVAYGLWTSSGAGTARVRTSAAVTAVVSPEDGVPDLYPGYDEGDLAFTIENPNAFPVNFTDMTSGAITSTDETNCPGETWITVADASDLDIYSPPGASGPLTIPDVVAMDANAPTGCQSESFDIEVTLIGIQTTAP